MVRVIWIGAPDFDEHPRDGVAAVDRARAAREEQGGAPIRLPALDELCFDVGAHREEEFHERRFGEVRCEEQRSRSVRLPRLADTDAFRDEETHLDVVKYVRGSESNCEHNSRKM